MITIRLFLLGDQTKVSFLWLPRGHVLEIKEPKLRKDCYKETLNDFTIIAQFA
jgi:hypothetical protein